MREISEVWCFGDISDVGWAVGSVFHISYLFTMKIS